MDKFKALCSTMPCGREREMEKEKGKGEEGNVGRHHGCWKDGTVQVDSPYLSLNPPKKKKQSSLF